MYGLQKKGSGMLLSRRSIDLVLAGSPCQGFSFIGKQLSFDDPRSKLFFVFVDIVNHIKSLNPDVKFLLENVRMKKDSLSIISEALNVYPMLINSRTLSAQNRPRYYWFNWECDQPENMDYRLADILETNVDDKYLCGAGQLNRLETSTDVPKMFSVIDPDVASCMTARQYANWKGNFVTTPKGLRRLTPVECERLQTLPDNYTAAVADNHRYKMIGNGWTVDVICHILESLNDTSTTS